jgi:hypothetical protein
MDQVLSHKRAPKVRSPYRRAKLYHLAGVGGGNQNRTNSESSAADPSQVVTPRANAT